MPYLCIFTVKFFVPKFLYNLTLTNVGALQDGASFMTPLCSFSRGTGNIYIYYLYPTNDAPSPYYYLLVVGRGEGASVIG